MAAVTVEGASNDGLEHVRADFDVAVGQSTLSHHMKTLRAAGVVRSRPENTRCYISLRPEIDERLPGLLAAVLSAARSERDRSASAGP